ncbi:FUN14 domain-containing protein 1A isoform X3 [Neodiprion pinetum]|uniref:FUN14 domain-containing protein 1A isoform X3 n=1 Tax=Neodiprion pinetum TaxID=441929 RepID=UPI001EDCDBC0|nr:FUN14 domain-containing protein 1A isoform X3 [Neodiprion pinetum]
MVSASGRERENERAGRAQRCRFFIAVSQERQIRRRRNNMSLPVAKRGKDDANKEIIDLKDVSKEAKSMIEKILGDVSKTSATKQIVIGTASGWTTGFLTMKVGKVAAFALGGGIIILQIAAHKGYIKVNWDKIQKKAEKLSDKVEEKVTGEGPKFMDKVGQWSRNNTYLATGFVGGFLIGLAS